MDLHKIKLKIFLFKLFYYVILIAFSFFKIILPLIIFVKKKQLKKLIFIVFLSKIYM